MNSLLQMAPVVVTPDMGDSKHAGLQVFWRLTGVMDKAAVDEALASCLPQGVLPAASNAQKYLRRALDVVRGVDSHNLVRKMEGQGFSLVSENASELDLEAAELKGRKADAFDVTMNASVVKDTNGNDSIKITPSSHPQAQALREEFERQRTLYHAGLDISSFLTTKVMKILNGVSMRDRGGVYILTAGQDSDRMKAVVNALHSISTFDASGKLLNGFKGYTVPVIFSEHLVDAVSDSLLEEVEALTSAVMGKIDEDSIGIRGWQGQRRIVLEQALKIEKYQSALGIGLGSLTAKTEELLSAIGLMEARLNYEIDNPEAPNL